MPETTAAPVRMRSITEVEPRDDSLVEQCRQGSQEAATQLYRRYVNRLRALAEAKCSAALSRRVDADDIVQSVFRTFFRGLKQGFYDIPEGEDLWKLFLVISLNKIRTKGAFHTAAKRDVRLTERVSANDSCMAQDHFNEVFLQMVMREAMDQLGPRQREMLELRLHGYNVDEIAVKTGRSKRTVERILQEVLNNLRDLLSQDQ
jgi:RNA polymerase sigma-70 factor (ECF subfamily)